jgi:hypothetical protein
VHLFAENESLFGANQRMPAECGLLLASIPQLIGGFFQRPSKTGDRDRRECSDKGTLVIKSLDRIPK